MADEKNASPGKDKLGIGTIIGVFVLAFLLINGSMYLLLNHVRSLYVLPYYQLLVQDSLRQDSLKIVARKDSVQLAMASLAGDFIESRKTNDSLAQVTRTQQGNISDLQSKIADWEQKDLQLTNEQIAKLAKIFGTMKPKNASPILQQMDDGSIVEVLFKIPDRQAAKIMAAMPASRAARLADRIRDGKKDKVN